MSLRRLIQANASHVLKNYFQHVAVRCLTPLLLAAVLVALPASGQTAGEGAIQGSVTDPTGALIPNANIKATNLATNFSVVRSSTSAGLYTISPLQPGIYKVEVSAAGFKTLVQDNVVVDALQLRALDIQLSIGEQGQTVTITAAPPILDTADATLGATVENQTYATLPLQMNNAQRDPTAFGALSPGAQTGSRLPVIGGTGNYLGQLYLDGMPAETVSQQGDNRLVSLTLSVDAIDQFQVVTSTPPAEYMGAGAENFTMKSGGLQYHGQVSDFVRNTVFDTWSFTAKAATIKSSTGATVPAPKPVEHQDEFSASAGGVVPFTGKKLFFFAAYDKFHSRRQANPALYTIPTALMRTGDFTELANATNTAFLFDPTSTSCSSSTTCTRNPLQGMKGGVATNNVIPSTMVSPIAQAMESFLPAVSNSNLANNYLGTVPTGFDNHLFDYRVDYDLSSVHRISTLGTIGVENYVNNFSAGGSGATAYGYLPLPYVGGDLANVYPKNFMVEDTYTLRPTITNQLKYSFTRFFQNIHDATQGVAAYSPTKLGITNLPLGQAGQEFPGVSFATTPAFGTALTAWTQYSNSEATQLTTPNNFALTDNVQWIKGRHSMTFGLTYQWQEINNANPATYSGTLQLPITAYSTANFSGSALTLGTATTPSGDSYASFLLGAIGGSPSLGLQPVSEEGGRYRPLAPYAMDSFKLNSKLTIDLGLRWDYLPPYHEVKDRWTFLNPALTNPLTNSAGMLEFAGSYGGAGVSCGCRTPVQTYWKNWGPRVGIAYEMNSKTVIRAGFGQVFSQGGGVGGRGGAFSGTGQTGFNMTATAPTEVTSGAAASPSFYLNNNTGFSQQNTSLFGPGFNYPAAPTPGLAAQELNTGFYVNAAGKFVTASSVAYADPYLSGRAPEIVMYNFGIERGITNDLTIAANYVGNEAHFLINSTSSGANPRGYWSNELNPQYLATVGSALDSTGTKNLLTAPATAANVTKLQSLVATAPNLPYFQAAAALNSNATISQMLVAFPQYSAVTDTWGQNVGNFAYNSLQITLQQRTSHGLTFNANYTYSKNIGDDGTFRSGFDIPAAALSRSTSGWHQNRIDRSRTTIEAPQSLHVYGTYQLPFGRGGIGGDNMLVRWIAGGWQASGIYTYSAGTPLAVVWSGCTTSTASGSATSPGTGMTSNQCMPDISPTFTAKTARINGSFGTGAGGVTNANLGTVQYIDPTAFTTPTDVSTTPTGAHTAQYLIGNAPRTTPLGLRGPGTQDLDMGIRRTFPLWRESLKFVFEANCINVWNKVTFANPNTTWTSGSTSFGTISGTASTYNPRDFQFAGHINF
jgi:hypothetical protein